VAVPVTLNGTVISRDPAKQKWDHETEDAYFRIKMGGSVHVYNLGVFVREFAGYHFGCGGEVVAKKQLKVNFARNDVQDDCPVWRRVKEVLNQKAMRKNKERLDDDGSPRFSSCSVSSATAASVSARAPGSDMFLA